jgi:hypothetical protein
MELLRRSWACTNVSAAVVESTCSFIEWFHETKIYYAHDGLSRIYNLTHENIMVVIGIYLYLCIHIYIYTYVYMCEYIYIYVLVYIDRYIHMKANIFA